MSEERFIRRREVENIIALSRSAIYAMIAIGEFPKPIPIGRYAVAWCESEVRAWMAARIAGARERHETITRAAATRIERT